MVTPGGLALRNARVTIIDSQNVRRIETTGSFGTFSFDNVQSGATYTITVSSRRYRFTPPIMPINGNLTDINFVGLE